MKAENEIRDIGRVARSECLLGVSEETSSGTERELPEQLLNVVPVIRPAPVEPVFDVQPHHARWRKHHRLRPSLAAAFCQLLRALL